MLRILASYNARDSERVDDVIADREQEIVEFVAEVPQTLHDLLRFGDPTGRQVVFQTANAIEVGVETTAGSALDEVEYVLAVAEG